MNLSGVMSAHRANYKLSSVCSSARFPVCRTGSTGAGSVITSQHAFAFDRCNNIHYHNNTNRSEVDDMATMQIRIDDSTKAAADTLFLSLGFDTPTAIRMFIAAALDHNGLPFEVKKPRKRIELNDGYGSYICEYGYLHDYKKLSQNPDFIEAIEDVRVNRNLHGPFDTVEAAMEALLEDDECSE